MLKILEIDKCRLVASKSHSYFLREHPLLESNHVSDPKVVNYSNIINSVCHPVKRLISRYYHALAIRPDTINDLGDFDHYQNKLKHFKKNATSEFQTVYDDENVKEKIQALTENFLERIFIG